MLLTSSEPQGSDDIDNPRYQPGSDIDNPRYHPIPEARQGGHSCLVLIPRLVAYMLLGTPQKSVTCRCYTMLHLNQIPGSVPDFRWTKMFITNESSRFVTNVTDCNIEPVTLQISKRNCRQATLEFNPVYKALSSEGALASYTPTRKLYICNNVT